MISPIRYVLKPTLEKVDMVLVEDSILHQQYLLTTGSLAKFCLKLNAKRICQAIGDIQ